MKLMILQLTNPPLPMADFLFGGLYVVTGILYIKELEFPAIAIGCEKISLRPLKPLSGVFESDGFDAVDFPLQPLHLPEIADALGGCRVDFRNGRGVLARYVQQSCGGDAEGEHNRFHSAGNRRLDRAAAPFQNPSLFLN